MPYSFSLPSPSSLLLSLSCFLFLSFLPHQSLLLSRCLTLFLWGVLPTILFLKCLGHLSSMFLSYSFSRIHLPTCLSLSFSFTFSLSFLSFFLSFLPTNSWLCYAESWSFGKWKRQPATNILSFFLSWKHKHRHTFAHTHSLSHTHSPAQTHKYKHTRAHTHSLHFALFTFRARILGLCQRARESERVCVRVRERERESPFVSCCVFKCVNKYLAEERAKKASGCCKGKNEKERERGERNSVDWKNKSSEWRKWLIPKSEIYSYFFPVVHFSRISKERENWLLVFFPPPPHRPDKRLFRKKWLAWHV